MLGGIRVFPRLRVRIGQGGSTGEICGPEGIELVWRSFLQSEDHLTMIGMEMEMESKVSEHGPFGNSNPSDREITSAVSKNCKHRAETILYTRICSSCVIPCQVSYDSHGTVQSQ